MKDYFNKIFNYNNWANLKLAACLKNQNIIDESVLRLFSHIVLSEQIWMLRMEGGDYLNKNFWEILILDECENIMNENLLKYKNLIAAMNFSDTIIYKNSKGVEYKNTIVDTLTHVAFHSAYHRGQMAKEIRRLGKEPVLTDYIAFIRDKELT
jgi:uncharacterized damage-inducible protein DinB